MITRAQHMAVYSDDPEGSHRAYYAQFVTSDVRRLVARGIGVPTIRASTDRDRAFNDIPLRRWDALVRQLPRAVVAQLKEAGDWLSLCTGVCILKEAARQLRDQGEPS